MKVDYNGHHFEFTNNSKVYKADGALRELSRECAAGYIPIRAMAADGGMIVEYHNAGLICIMKSSAMNTANYDWLLTSTAMCLDLYK